MTQSGATQRGNEKADSIRPFHVHLAGLDLTEMRTQTRCAEVRNMSYSVSTNLKFNLRRHLPTPVKANDSATGQEK